MLYVKCAAIAVFLVFVITACLQTPAKHFSIAESKAYEASLFRQNCAICHGPEGEGKTTDDGKKVPSLREGDFKFKTEEEIYNQIANGGNGMTPFRSQLTEREMRMMAKFVKDDLRK